MTEPKRELPVTPPRDLPLNAPVCDLCGATMLGLHCKLRCEACGFVRDCSDL